MSYENKYFDIYSRGQTTIDTVHKRNHEGRLFGSGYYAESLASDAIVNILIKVPIAAIQKSPAHGISTINTSGLTIFEFFEGSIVSADGNPLSVFNYNRLSSRVSEITIFEGPAITDDGISLIPTRVIPGASIKAGGGGTGGFDSEIITKFNTNYLLRITNKANGNITISIGIIWYEGAGP